MRKILWILLPLLAVLLIIAVSAVALILNLQPAQSSEPGENSNAELLSYVQKNWQLGDAEYAGGVLTVRKTFDLSYEQACKLGGNIFVDDLAPESYLSLVATLSADLSSQFSNAPALVVLRYCSNDGQTIFSVDSEGNISTCWE